MCQQKLSRCWSLLHLVLFCLLSSTVTSFLRIELSPNILRWRQSPFRNARRICLDRSTIASNPERRRPFTTTTTTTCLTIMANSAFFFEDEEVSDISVKVWEGAGVPRSDLPPEELPSLLMNALRLNDLPSMDAGLNAMWEFAGDTTRHIFQHNRTEFVESAHETADTLPTSFYGVAMNGKDWMIESPLNRVGGEDGWIATQVMKTVCSDGRIRRWQWELRKTKRPPNLGAWYVENIGSSNRKGDFEAE